MSKRWIISAGAMLAVYAAVATTAFAVFVPQARLQGVTFSTANSSLKVAPDQDNTPPDSAFQSTITLAGASSMYPGMPTVKQRFWLQNASPTNQTLATILNATPGDKDWEALKYLIAVRIRDLTLYSEMESGWMTLGELETYPLNFPNMYQYPNQKRRFELEYAMGETYGLDPDGSGPIQENDPIGAEATGKSTSGINFLIDGQIVAEP